MSSPAPWNDARSKLEAAALVAADHIQWPNEPFTEPVNDLWLAVQMTGDVLAPIELGNGVWQEEGQLFVSVIVPAFSGTDAARAMAKSVANVYRGLQPAPVIYYNAAIGGGVAEETAGGFWGLMVTVSWKYQDIETA